MAGLGCSQYTSLPLSETTVEGGQLAIRAEERQPFVIEPMEMDDIPAVMAVERQSFTMPWPGNAYRRELAENRLAHYVVARRTFPVARSEEDVSGGDASSTVPSEPGGLRGLWKRIVGGLGGPVELPALEDERSRRVVGYAGIWLMVDEAHVTTIAVAPAYRGLGVGELLLLSLVDISRSIGAQYLTLEVRVSNTQAQNLYRKYLFKETGVRRRYYSDNNEDALIMWSDPLESPGFLATVEEHRRALAERLRSPRTLAELRSRGAQA